MNIEKLRENLEKKKYTFTYFETSAQAREYILSQLEGKKIGIGGSGTIDSMDMYDELCKKNDVAWHWKSEPNEARERAMVSEVYMTSANAIAETGEIINIDGNANRVAAMVFGREKVYIIAGKNKVEADYDKAMWRARNVASPLRARSLSMETPCVKGELRCHDCSSPARICRNLSVLWCASNGVGNMEVVLINEDLGM